MTKRSPWKSKRTARGPRVMAWAGVVTLLVACLVAVIGFAPLFVLENLDVTGGPQPVVEAATRNAEAPFGRPLARIDTGAISERVLADPRIGEVSVGRSWPSTVTVELSMRKPAAVLRQEGEPLRLVDAQGVAFEQIEVAPTDLRTISAPIGKVSADSVAGALEAAAALEQAQGEQVTGMGLTADGDIRLAMGSIRIYWGQPADVKAKAAATTALLAQDAIDPGNEDSMIIDVTAPQAPVVTGLPLVP